jgi:hypothetical protein
VGKYSLSEASKVMDDKNKWLDAGIENMLKNPAYAKSNTTILKNMLPQKMSAVLLDFAKPLLDAIDLSDETTLRSAIMVAVTIWNYTILNDENAQPKPLMDGLDKETIIATIEKAFRGYVGGRIFADLLGRKKSLYPDNYRIIGDFNINWNKSKTEFHLTVLTSD